MSEEKSSSNADKPEEALKLESSEPPQEEESKAPTIDQSPTIPEEPQNCEPDVQESSIVEVEPQPPTMFGLVPEKCVTFCIDTSGSMFKSLPVVKEHLMETLHSLSRCRDEKAMFNLIEFNSQVRNIFF